MEAHTTVAKVKGLQLLGLVKLLRKNRERALQLLAPDLHHYLEERVVVSSWYPENDQEQLLLAAGEIMRGLVSGDDRWLALGDAGAERDLSGPYANFVRKGDPAATLEFSTRAWKLYHDTGRLVVSLPGPGSARIELHDFHRLRSEIARVDAGYFRGLLRIAGAVAPEVTVLPYTGIGDKVTVWSASWR